MICVTLKNDKVRVTAIDIITTTDKMESHRMCLKLRFKEMDIEYEMAEEICKQTQHSIPSVSSGPVIESIEFGKEMRSPEYLKILTFNYPCVKTILERYGYYASTGLALGRDFIGYDHTKVFQGTAILVYSLKSETPSFEMYKNVIRRTAGRNSPFVYL